jgi:1,4-dihydroxy-2-naphthoate octaprenyltransferase
MKAILKLNVFFALLFFHCSVNGVNYYVNSVTGSDTNSGVSTDSALCYSEEG